MTMLSRFGPLATTILLGVLVTSGHRRLPPRLAARMAMATLVAITLAAIPSLWLLSLGFLAHVPLVGSRLQWCAMVLGIHHQVPAIAGIPAILVSSVGLARSVRVLRLHRRVVCHDPGAIEVVDGTDAYAVTIPGRGGRIVISTAMCDLLDDDERRVVLAHEEAHARFRHDRYLLAGRLANALLPGTRRLSDRLHFIIERWADETAAAHRGDRRFVAATLAKVALCVDGQPRAFALGFAGLGVTARVAALLEPRRPRPHRVVIAGLWLSIAATAGLATMQVHHLAALITALCPGG